jgi:hypothetical protein
LPDGESEIFLQTGLDMQITSALADLPDEQAPRDPQRAKPAMPTAGGARRFRFDG